MLCFDHGGTAPDADLSRDTLMGVCHTKDIPTASYTHGRVKVDWARYTVAGTLHYTGQSLPGEFWLTFPYSRPLLVVHDNEDRHWARFFWEVFEAFRWEERGAAGYLDGVWDVGTADVDTETVVNPGATGYHVTASTD